MKIILNRTTLLNGGATSPTVVLYQLASGRCRLYWYACDQDGIESHTITAFKEKNWKTAQVRGRAILSSWSPV